MADGERLRRFAPWVILLAIAAVVAAGRWWPAPAPAPIRVDCPSLAAGCQARLGDATVTLGASGAIKVLSPFEVWLRGVVAREVQASFTMEGMDMGFNLYTLRPDGQGGYRARVTLPVCVTGRRDWILTLTIDGQQMAVPFVTEL